MADKNKKLVREAYKTNIKKIFVKVDESFDDKDTIKIDKSELTILNDSLQKYAQKVDILNSEILAAFVDENDDLVPEMENSIEFDEKIWHTQSKLSILLEQSSVTNNPNANTNGSEDGNNTSMGRAQVNLPKLDLPHFNGDPTKWQEFWDSFDTTVHQTDLPTVDKLKYLRGLLEGDAIDVVGGFRVVGANYDTMVDTLKQRFGNTEIAIFAHFDQLLALPQSGNDTHSLQKTYDKCEQHVRSLVALGLEEQTFGVAFCPIILSKMPKFVRVELHRKNDGRPWKLGSLRDFLKKEIEARQMGDWAISTPGTSSKQSNQNSKSTQNNHNKATTDKNKSISSNSQPTNGVMLQTNNKVACTFCKGNHYSDQCSKVTTFAARKEIISKNKQCFKCLSTKHPAKECPKQVKCFYCSHNNHHSSLCMKKYGSKNESSFITQGTVSNDTNDTQNSINHDQESNVDTHTHTHTHTAVNNTSVFMQTAQVTFTSADGKPVHARVYLDPGSSCSYITTALSKQLQLKSEGELTVSNARFEDSQRRVKPYEFITFSLPASDGSSVPITAFITNNISVALQKLPLNTVAFPILKTIPLADPLCDKPEFLPIDILLGGDFYYDVVDSEQIRLGQGLVLLGSKLGYITAGMVKNGSSTTSETDTFAVSMLNAVQTGSRLCNSVIQQFWSLEDIGIKDDAHQQDDDFAAKQFQDSVEMKDGRYNVRWPWKSGESELPDNRELALSRLRFLKKRLDKQPEVRKVYDATIQQQLKSNIIEPVSENENQIPNGRIHYIPHHCVVKPDRTTTKLRIVYDASSKANSSLLSLNDCLYRGPVFLSNLCGLLLRFRLKTYAVASDIEKAFLQVGLQEIDRDVTRFFWLKDIDKPLTPENLIVYRFVRVLFGVISSPFMLSGTIKHHMSIKNTATAESISDNSYVDNIFNCFDSVDEVLQFYSTAKEYFAEIGMNLREWITNCPDLINSIPDVDKGPQQQTKVLGIMWNPGTDTLAAANPKLDGLEVHTKRQLLQATSRIFDPCGWFAPVVVSLKLLVQNLWKIKLGWDDKLPDEFHAQWSNIVDDAKQVSELEIPRCVKTNSSSPSTLHCFCDASGRAYAAAVYLHTDDSVNLISLLSQS